MIVTNYKKIPKRVSQNMTSTYFDIRYINILRKYVDKHCSRDDVIVPFRSFRSENGISRVGLLVEEISTFVTIAQEMGMSFAEITSKECEKFYETKHVLSVEEIKTLKMIKAKHVIFAKFLLEIMRVHDYEESRNKAEAEEEDRVMKRLLDNLPSTSTMSTNTKSSRSSSGIIRCVKTGGVASKMTHDVELKTGDVEFKTTAKVDEDESKVKNSDSTENEEIIASSEDNTENMHTKKRTQEDIIILKDETAHVSKKQKLEPTTTGCSVPSPPSIDSDTMSTQKYSEEMKILKTATSSQKGEKISTSSSSRPPTRPKRNPDKISTTTTTTYSEQQPEMKKAKRNTHANKPTKKKRAPFPKSVPFNFDI